MPNKTSLLLNKTRGSHRRKAALGLAVAASLNLMAGCSDTGSTGTNLDMAGSGSPDMTLPVTPPPGSHRVSVTLAGTGTGSVTSQPGSISCGIGSMVCVGDFVDGSTVVLIAAGANGSAFISWAGACAGQGAVCTLPVNADQTTTASFGPQSCSPDGVCWEAPLPFGYDLNSVAAISPTDVWAVGNSGAAVHYDGQNWSHVLTGTTADLNDVWARASNDVWATAGAGKMLHWTGAAWTVVSTGFAADINTLVWGTPNRLFVATQKEFVLVFDGVSWVKQDTGTRVDTPLTGITGTSNSDIWVMGSDNYICHFVTSWACTRPDIGTMSNYANTTGVFSVSATDIWEVTSPGYYSRNNPPNFGVVGYGFANPTTKLASSVNGLWGTSSTSLFTNGSPATLYHYDGTSWKGIPTGVKDVLSLSKVHGTGNSDVWAVGQRGVIAHYDGTLAAVKRGNIFTGTNMTGVWASGVNDAWFTTNAGTVVHYDGASFSESQPLVTGGGSGLKTISGTSATDVWVGGSDGVSPVIKHWDGKAWTLIPEAQFFSGFAIDTMYAGSKNVAFATGAPALGVEKWDGTAWKNDTTLPNLTNPVLQMWGSSDTNVLAIESASTKLWLYNGAAWTVDPRISAALSSLGGSSGSDIWAGGLQGVYHFDGTTWSAKLPIAGSTGTINSVSSVANNDAWAVDQNGGAFHFDGTTWKQIDTGISTASGAKMSAFSVNNHLTWLAGRGILSVRK